MNICAFLTKKAVFSPYIRATWEEPLCRALYIITKCSEQEKSPLVPVAHVDALSAVPDPRPPRPCLLCGGGCRRPRLWRLRRAVQVQVGQWQWQWRRRHWLWRRDHPLHGLGRLREDHLIIVISSRKASCLGAHLAEISLVPQTIFLFLFRLPSPMGCSDYSQGSTGS